MKSEVHLIPADENNYEESAETVALDYTNAQSTVTTQDPPGIVFRFPLLDAMIASAAKERRLRNSITNTRLLRLPSWKDQESDLRSYHSEDSEDIDAPPPLEDPGVASSSDSDDSWIPPRSSRAANCLVTASRIIEDSGLDMTPLQFLEDGLNADEDEDALVFDTSED